MILGGILGFLMMQIWSLKCPTRSQQSRWESINYLRDETAAERRAIFRAAARGWKILVFDALSIRLMNSFRASAAALGSLARIVLRSFFSSVRTELL